MSYCPPPPPCVHSPFPLCSGFPLRSSPSYSLFSSLIFSSVPSSLLTSHASSSSSSTSRSFSFPLSSCSPLRSSPYSLFSSLLIFLPVPSSLFTSHAPSSSFSTSRSFLFVPAPLFVHFFPHFLTSVHSFLLTSHVTSSLTILPVLHHPHPPQLFLCPYLPSHLRHHCCCCCC